MIKHLVLLSGALISAPAVSQSQVWFESNTPLTQTHKHLLNNDLESMFTSLVEMWQLEPSESLQTHLNQILVQSLEIDCGKGLSSQEFPDWLKGVSVQRSEIQSPGRDAFRANVEVQTTAEISEISLMGWVNESVSNDTTLELLRTNASGVSTFSKRYNINNELSEGLYRVEIISKTGDKWSSWLIFADPKVTMSLRWASKDFWQVEQHSLLNSNCPLPKLNAALYDYVDGTYNQVWKGSYESDYPTSLPLDEIDPGRYVLAVSMAHRRWQGKIMLEQTQIISKTYDVSVEE